MYFSDGRPLHPWSIASLIIFLTGPGWGFRASEKIGITLADTATTERLPIEQPAPDRTNFP